MNTTVRTTDVKCTLGQFCGTTQRYRRPPGLLWTDGVNYLADEAGAYGLIDAIATCRPQFGMSSGTSVLP